MNVDVDGGHCLFDAPIALIGYPSHMGAGLVADSEHATMLGGIR